ncbi:MAG: 4Fe-4S binding protein [Candidatus Helarchaeota archaeon]|nr:4Fe-4S binding protein [Candidatus Helarchaeota archaeon]
MAVTHQIYRGTSLKTCPLDSYCPFGAIETAYLYLTSGTFVLRVGYSNFILLFGLIVMGVILKSGFCGWICPFGTVQEWLGKLGKKLFGNKKFIPERVDRYGRFIKYPLFILIIIATIISGRMIFRDYDPFIAFFHMGFGELPWTAYFVMFIVLVGSLFILRFWCRYFCPLAVIVGLIGKLGLYKIECDEEKCVSCGKCEKLCPMDVKIAKMGRIKTVECNSCLDCLEARDLKDAISLKLPKSGKRLIPAFYPMILLVIFFGIIYSSKSLGIWKPGRGPGRQQKPGFRSSQIIQGTIESMSLDTLLHKGDSLEVRSGLRKAAEAEETAKGEERTIKIGDKKLVVRGNLSLSQIERITGVPSSYLISKLKLPPNVSRNVNLGNLRKRYGFMMQDVRKFIREYLEKYKK